SRLSPFPFNRNMTKCKRKGRIARWFQQREQQPSLLQRRQYALYYQRSPSLRLVGASFALVTAPNTVLWHTRKGDFNNWRSPHTRNRGQVSGRIYYLQEISNDSVVESDSGPNWVTVRLSKRTLKTRKSYKERLSDRQASKPKKTRKDGVKLS